MQIKDLPSSFRTSTCHSLSSAMNLYASHLGGKPVDVVADYDEDCHTFSVSYKGRHFIRLGSSGWPWEMGPIPAEPVSINEPTTAKPDLTQAQRVLDAAKLLEPEAFNWLLEELFAAPEVRNQLTVGSALLKPPAPKPEPTTAVHYASGIMARWNTEPPDPRCEKIKADYKKMHQQHAARHDAGLISDREFSERHAILNAFERDEIAAIKKVEYLRLLMNATPMKISDDGTTMSLSFGPEALTLKEGVAKLADQEPEPKKINFGEFL
jgi:hypothetical protein